MTASHQTHQATGGVPRIVLFGAAGLVLFTMAAAGGARLSDIGTQHRPPARSVAQLELRFVDGQDGSVAVRDATRDETIYRVEPGTNGFIRATLRGLVRERKRSGIGDDTPFQLTRWSDGGMSLNDPTTGRGVSLEAFGPTNAEAFAQLFTARSNQP